MKKLIFFLVLVVSFCNVLAQKSIDSFRQFEKQEVVINLDSIYPSKKYRILLYTFTNENSYENGIYNTVFTFQKKVKGRYMNILRDSIQSHFGDLRFDDFNGDGIADILIENISDVRSNRTYYLYLVNLQKDELKNVKGFNKIKNPTYNKKYNIIDNLVMSGRNWSSFYYIKNGEVVNFEEKYIVHWTNEEDTSKTDKEYERILKKVVGYRKRNQ